jgi:para-nitrobenzyl esterase
MPQSSDSVDIDTAEGPVRGMIQDGLAIFRGVPFAQPPVGSLRFKPPIPPAVRSARLDVTAPAPICPQLPSRLSVAMGELSGRQDEDCLRLTIWAPLSVDRKRPVVLFIHGGAFLSGGGSLAWYDGARLARENDVVVVGVNYRLGALGFLYKPGLVDGNLGLLDQIRAIEWVNENAASFGGDPRQLTVMGQSAGAISIACLLAVPRARQLFQRAILLSGGLHEPMAATKAIAVAEHFCTSLGIDPSSPDASHRLQQVPLARILEAQLATMRGMARTPGDAMPVFSLASVSGLPAGPALEAAVREGAKGLEVLVGSTAEEMRIFQGLDPTVSDLRLEDLSKVAQGLFGESAPSRLDRARRSRPGATPNQLFMDAYTDWLAQTGRRIAVLAAEGSGKAWLCRFDWSAPESGYGACHCIDLPFVFGTFDAFKGAKMLAGAHRIDMEAVSAVMRSAIGRFVHGGSPAGADIPDWPPFSRSQPVMLVFNSALQHGWLAAQSV